MSNQTRRPPKKFVPIPFGYHEEIELEIDALSNLGAGIGRVDGWVVFVAFALPGERVRARVFRNEKNFSQADLVEVLRPSPDRQQPSCQLFGQCGGCQYQHLAYERQLDWKTRQVAELFRHLAGEDVAVARCIGSPQLWGYRSKITPHFDQPRQGQIGPIGFHGNGPGRQLVDVERCEIALAEINAALPVVRAQVHAKAAQFRRGATLLMRVGHNGQVHTRPDEVCQERVGELVFEFLAGDFFQNNPYILPIFTEYVVKEAAQMATETRLLVDAYCGSGLFALAAARSFEQVIAVEVSETGAEWARHNAKCNQLDNVTVIAADAASVFAAVPGNGSQAVVIIDPPRKGCDSEFLSQLIRFAPRRIVYVSCDPATQVRDYQLLRLAGYKLVAAQPFDLFPHTRHIENVLVLDRASS